MTPCEEIIWKTIRDMAAARGEAVNISLISRKAYVSLQHTRRCIRVLEVDLQRINRFLEPGKPARLVIKTKESKQ